MIADTAKLIRKSYSYDSIGQPIEIEEVREVFVELSSITRQEWTEAGRMGFNPSIRLVTPFSNYDDEDEVEFHGKRYSVYRTFISGDNIEIYLEKKGGLRNGGN